MGWEANNIPKRIRNPVECTVGLQSYTESVEKEAQSKKLKNLKEF
jgi:hypothetical protein